MPSNASTLDGATVNRFAQIFLPFAAGYFLSYLFRSVNAVIAGDLETDVGVGASELGLLTASYLLAFALFQLPLGILLDRLGPRRVESVLLLIAGAGALVFALGQGLLSLTVGRALIGLGVSACLMASLKAFALWYRSDQLPAINGYLLAFGGLGAITATAPVEAMLGITTWRVLFIGLAAGCLLTAAALWLAVPERGRSIPVEPLAHQIAGLVFILRSRRFWRVAPAAMLFPGGLMAIQGLWAGPWLRDVAGFDRGMVAHYLLMLAVATTVGFAAWGHLTSRLARQGVDMLRVISVGLVLFCVTLALLASHPRYGLLAIWLVMGFASTSGALFYAALSRQFEPELMGRVVTALNLMVFLGAFGLQWGMGIIIELPDSPAGAGYAQGYQAAFGLTAALQAAAFLWLLWPVRGHEQPMPR